MFRVCNGFAKLPLTSYCELTPILRLVKPLDMVDCNYGYPPWLCRVSNPLKLAELTTPLPPPPPPPPRNSLELLVEDKSLATLRCEEDCIIALTRRLWSTKFLQAIATRLGRNSLVLTFLFGLK